MKLKKVEVGKVALKVNCLECKEEIKLVVIERLCGKCQVKLDKEAIDQAKIDAYGYCRELLTKADTFTYIEEALIKKIKQLKKGSELGLIKGYNKG